jgi:hypothetical protein
VHSSSRPTYEELLAGARKLDATQQLRLLEELASTVRRGVEDRRGHSVMELQGLGKEIWQGVDAQKYVDRERTAWNG